MKKYIILSMICLAFLSCKAQVTQTVPLKSFVYDYDSGVYLKDLNNELTLLAGTWEGILDNKKYIFTFTLFTQYQKTGSGSFYYYEDDVKGKFKVIDLSNNQVLYDDLQVTDYNDHKITDVGGIFHNEYYSLFFIDNEAHCGNQVEFYLEIDDNNPNQLIYKDFSYEDFGILYGNNDFGCPYYQNQEDIPMFLPKDTFILTKQ